MRPIYNMDTIQLEVTNSCIFRCANCTRFCGHKKPFFMTWEQFTNAVDSLVGFPNMVGIMGGEPLLHPSFEKFCDYALEKLGKEHLGLWSTFPPKFEKYREVICRTFDHVFLNDHSRGDIYHAPVLVASEEMVADERTLFAIVEKCWVQNSWSASISPRGAFFCEVAGALDELFEGSGGWKVEPGWWLRIPKDFASQMEEHCKHCGCAFPLARRASVDERDDISPGNLERLKKVGSKKVERGDYVVSDFKMVDQPDPNGPAGPNNYPAQVYKDMQYRRGIADRYGIFISVNSKGYLTPYLKKDWDKNIKRTSLLEQFKKEAATVPDSGTIVNISGVARRHSSLSDFSLGGSNE